jgi:chitinase
MGRCRYPSSEPACEGGCHGTPDLGVAGSFSLGECLRSAASLAFVALVSLSPTTAFGEVVFGYYPGYEWKRMTPDKIDWAGINCIVHFAADPKPNGSLDLNRFQLYPDRVQQVIELARQHKACVLLAVGGGDSKARFAGATANPGVRARFVRNIVDAVVEHGYDGVDIDWEPLPDGKEVRFTALIRELRAALDARAPEAMLTAAVEYQRGTSQYRNTAAIVAGVIDELDFVHLMAYGLAGPWDGWASWHNSALFSGGQTQPTSTRELPSAELMVEEYAAAGVPPDKMTLGVAFFGKLWQGGAGTSTGGISAPRQRWTTPPTMSGEYPYHRIVARSDFPSKQRWDRVARSPYLGVDNPGSANDLFLPFENERSIRQKVRYAASERLGGLMIWQLSGDYLPNGRHPLLDSLKREYKVRYGTLPGDLPRQGR